MKKLLICFLSLVVILTCFSSCDKSSDDMFTAEDGNSYIVVRNDEGRIVINDNDKLQVYTLNENGKKQKDDSGNYITEYIDFNGQVVIGNTVETAEMKYKLPSGFVDDSDNSGYFYNENINAEIFFVFYGTDIGLAVEAAERNCQSLLESYGSDVFEYTRYTVDIDGVECTAFRQRCVSSEYPDNSCIYYIPFDGGYYIVHCRVNIENEKRVNFDKFVNTIEFM